MGFKSSRSFPISRTGLIANFINGKGGGWSSQQVGSQTIYNLGAISATGGTKVTSGGKSAHIFTSTGPFSISGIQTGGTAVEIEYFIVAGGGGGGYGVGGGGGGGGIQEGTLILSLPTETSFPQPYTFTVGGGGPINSDLSGSNGTPSSAFDIIAAGGGYGGAGSAAGGPGGTGGGSGYGSYAPNRASGNIPAGLQNPQGANGGVQNPGAPISAGGGGGGGRFGVQGGDSVAGPPKVSGPGGDGTSITWAQIPASYGEAGPNPGRYFSGGGGGGGTPQYTTTRGVGGAGGGGDGGNTTDSQAGTNNTGGGGGGGGNQPGLSFDGSAGGSGIIMIRYTPL